MKFEDTVIDPDEHYKKAEYSLEIPLSRFRKAYVYLYGGPPSTGELEILKRAIDLLDTSLNGLPGLDGHIAKPSPDMTIVTKRGDRRNLVGRTETEKIFELYRSGMSVVKIAAIVNRPYSTIIGKLQSQTFYTKRGYRPHKGEPSS